jgi:hypothetical protein
MQDAATAFTGLFGLFIFILMLIVIVAWIVLPFTINSKLAKIEKHLRKINEDGDVRNVYRSALLEDIKGNTRRTADALDSADVEVRQEG